MTIAKKILKNSASNSAAFMVEAITAFLMMPFVIKYLGDDSYGIWVLVSAMTGYLGLFKLGFRPSINKHVAEFKAHNDFTKLREFVAGSLHIYMYISVAIFITSLLVSYFVPQLFNLENDYLVVFQILILFSGVQSVFSLIGTAYGGVISGYQRYEINAGIEIFVILVRAAIIIYFLPDFQNLYTMAAAHFSITIIGYLLTIVMARIISPVKALKITKKPSKEILSIIIKYNSISFSIAAIGILISYVDTIIVGLILPLSVITHYAIGDRLVKYTISFLSVTTRVIAPAISELKAKNNMELVTQVLLNIHKVSCIIAYPVLLCLIVQGAEFINLWMGDGYSDSADVMFILAVLSLIIAPSQVINPFLYGLGKHKYLLYFLIIEVLISVPLCYYLGTEYGIMGIAAGLSIPRALLRAIALPIMLNYMLEIKIAFQMFYSQIRVLIGSVPYVLLLVYSKNTFALDTWLVFFSQLIVALSVHFLFMYYIILTKIEKQLIFDKLLKRNK